MPDEDALAVVRSLYRAFEDGDHDAIRACVATDLRWRQAATAVPAAGEDVVGGEELIRRVIRPIEDEWDGFTETVEHLVGSEGNVVATGTYRGRFRATGRDLEAEFCHLWTVEDGAITAFRQFTDTAAFVDATLPVPGDR